MASTRRYSVKERCFNRCSSCWCFAPISSAPLHNIVLEQPAPTNVSSPNLAGAPQPTPSPCVSAQQSAANLAPTNSPAPFDPQLHEQPAAKLEPEPIINSPPPSHPQLIHEDSSVKLEPSPIFSHLEEQDLKDKVKHLTVEDLDALLFYIEAELERLDPSLPATSSSNLIPTVLSECQKQKDVASCFVQTLPENVTKQVIGASESIFLPLLKQTLGGMGNVHWAGLALSFIAWSLDNMGRTSQNHENSFKLLRKVVSLLSNIRNLVSLEDIHDDYRCMQDLQDSTEIALRCAIICSSSLNQGYLSRFFKAAKAEEVISAMEKELDGAKVTNIVIGINAMIAFLKKVPPKEHGPITFTSDDEGLVGRVEEMQTVFDYLKMDCDNIVAACLHGMGGIGKSTQAFSIYMKFQEMQVYRCCMVTLELETKKEELHNIQWDILQKVCKGEIGKFSNDKEGKERMKTELPKGGAILLYLDNVMEPGHLTDLLPYSTYFPRGSKILITTRNKNVFYDFKQLKIEHCKCFEVKKLEKEVARQFFLKQIGRDCVGTVEESKTLEKLKEEVLELCDGLPLALKVVSGYIANSEQDAMDVELWREVVQRMKEGIPLEGGAKDPLYSSLEFSIDQLDPNFKGAFLDIVVFGVGKSWEYAQRLVGKGCLEQLFRRSLIQKTISTQKDLDVHLVEVHDVIRTMGKQMAARDDHSEIRITNQTEFLNLNKESLKSIVGLRGIVIREADLLQQMTSLRVLDEVKIMDVECPTTKLQHLKAIQIYSHLPRPIDFSACSGLKHLSWFHITEHLDLEMIQGMTQLEALNLQAYSPPIIVPLHNAQVVESFTKLKELRLRNFRSLQQLSKGIAKLTGLRELDLSRCPSLVSLPEGMGNLTGLRALDLSWCKSLVSLPEGMGNLTGMRALNLSGCESLVSLPKGMGNLTGLRAVHLYRCESLVSLPEGMGNLTGLRELDLWYCRGLISLPEGMGNLTGLRKLHLCGCESLVSLPEGMGNLTGLRELNLSGCKSLVPLPEGMGNLTGLRELDLSSCGGLVSLPEEMGNLTGLRGLDLSWCGSLVSLPEEMGKLTGLRELHLYGCGNLVSLPEGMGNLTGLRQLNLRWCGSLVSLPEDLRMLGLKGCLRLLLPEQLENATPTVKRVKGGSF